jgi:hypothetical protein
MLWYGINMPKMTKAKMVLEYLNLTFAKMNPIIAPNITEKRLTGITSMKLF